MPYEYVWGSGVLAPRVLNIGTRCMWVVSFMSRQLYFRKRAPSTHLIGSWVDPRAVLEAVTKRKNSCPCQKCKRSPSARSLVTILTELSRFTVDIDGIKFIRKACSFALIWTETKLPALWLVDSDSYLSRDPFSGRAFVVCPFRS